MVAILGISAFYHDSAAAIIVDGKIIAAAQEERFYQKETRFAYPFNAIEFVLRFNNLKLSQIDHVVFYEKPFLKFERLLETYVAFAPRFLYLNNLQNQCHLGLEKNYFKKICL